ncbi:PREDICTED: 39S ribosomal protein L38, mitochondrial [Dufourea novaeangliae]|uniref:Large ribosomal subunit protein mL38 n=1 Tax=Dufourea novaeangliae TaxID=178035 RepID=A0A154P084_DUFNO|nr:PREDICTED: 39S ribosomal protein L38, mitochondrial [Dufourea novaeangliae]KZC04668.1 39S ribosomal protein L38, mitochondrial [Dufourea novaeangliae]
MATTIFRIFANDFSPSLKHRIQQIRHGHRIRGKPPMIAHTLKQRLESLNATDPTVSFKVNIGFSIPKRSRRTTEIWMAEKEAIRMNPEAERQSRKRLLSVDLNQVKETWLDTLGPIHVHKIAYHYGIFQDLFGDAYFMPVVPLKIDYNTNDDTLVRVYTGNVIKPSEADKPPIIKYKAETDTLWTLIMSTPDGNLQNSNNEYCHWFLGNIPGNNIEYGEQIIDYLKPIPCRGVGYYRYIFMLYKQNQPLDYTKYKKPYPCLQLNKRDWNTLNFYREHQENLTPAGLAFFQSDWDPTVKKFYHSSLNTEEPIFQYDFPKPYIKPQTWFPLKEPFNLYLDKYRDPKEISKEFLLRKMKNVHPFREAKPPLKYPNACAFEKNLPSWLKLEMKKERIGWGRVNDIK